jgi:hypothetical protein
MADKRVLLVEGKDDLHVIAHILKNHGLEGKIKIKDQEGISNLTKGINPELFDELLNDLDEEIDATSELEKLGIVVDADLDIQARWESLANRLRDLDYENVPPTPNPNGIILQNRGDRVPIGVWIMPDNQIPTGILENFVKMLVPEERNSLLKKAVETVESIPEEERLFSNVKIAKAEIHTYLAWQSRPGLPFGVAIREKYLQADNPNCESFVNWLKRLFVE